MFQVIYTMFFKETQDIITSSYVFDTYEEVQAFINDMIVRAENGNAKTCSKVYRDNDLYVKIETDTTIHYYTLLEN